MTFPALSNEFLLAPVPNEKSAHGAGHGYL